MAFVDFKELREFLYKGYRFFVGVKIKIFIKITLGMDEVY